ncbi:hypothetical protein BC629DRAFT_1593292 [Irpex lacteus]|nr:hypothetical protein BC629DRAFT_1593292 [Irpex lacteus]
MADPEPASRVQAAAIPLAGPSNSQISAESMVRTGGGTATETVRNVTATPTHMAASESVTAAQQTVTHASDTWFWNVILLLSAWLHIRHFTTHAAIGLMLHILKSIFVALGLLQPNTAVPVTLRTAFKRLDLEDQFTILPMCPDCLWTHHTGDLTAEVTNCLQCDVALFKEVETLPLDERSFPFTAPRLPPSKPRLQAPYILPSRLIAQLLTSTPSMEADLEKWRGRRAIPGRMMSIQDGKIWKTLPAADGGLFFDNSPGRANSDELRIGVTCGFDGFSFVRSSYAGRHSTGVLSLSLANLDNDLRYRPQNVMLSGVTPGPHELNADQLQQFNKAFVSDLLDLYENGMIVKTPTCPEGRLVRVILVAVCCDHPAMCRMCGFGDHGTKSAFCHRCTAPRSSLSKDAGITIGAFPARDGNEHKARSAEYAKLSSDRERQEFVKKHSARYYELSRLPYFDPIRMTVVDPMHNILLGIVKTVWYDGWILGNALRKDTKAGTERELHAIYEYLDLFEMPAWVARLPSEVGAPAGGSLTSDEWKGLALVYCPIIIPLIWDQFGEAAEADYQRKLAKWNEDQAQPKDKRKPSDSDKEKPTRTMHGEDSDSFLSLAASLKVILARSIDHIDLPSARENLQQFLDNFKRVHPDLIKPNFHYVTHIFDQIEDFGPVYGFWTYLFERLNKMLKSYAVNNHGGGELEVTFMREYHRETRLRTMVSVIANQEIGQATSPTDTVLIQSAKLMQESRSETRGTIASICQESESAIDEAGLPLTLGLGATEELSQSDQASLLHYYQTHYPDENIVARGDVGDFILSGHDGESERSDYAERNFLNNMATLHKNVFIQGRRIDPSNCQGKAPNSIIRIYAGSQWYVGEVTGVVSHVQPRVRNHPLTLRLLRVQWFVPYTNIDTVMWAPYPALEVQFWKYRQYLSENHGPGRLISIHETISQAGRVAIAKFPLKDENTAAEDVPSMIWGTVGLTRDAAVF